jgi:hypothetical protein
MKLFGRKVLVLGVAAIFTGGLSSCLSMQNQTTLDQIQGEAGKQPFVEAYVEFIGPQAKWAGPATLTVHVNARGDGKTLAKIDVNPMLFKKRQHSGPPEVRNRVLASSHAISAESARDSLGVLASVIQSSDPEFQGCLYPLRVRMIRADGSLLEKQGCRATVGWPRLVSKKVDEWIAAVSP